MSTTLADRLRHILTLRGITAYELSKRAGLNAAQVSAWIDRNSTRVDAQRLASVARAAEVSERWLIHGDGEPEDGRDPTPSEDATPQDVPPGCLADSPTYAQRKTTARRLAPEIKSERTWSKLDRLDTLWLGTRAPSARALAELARILDEFGEDS